MRTTLDLEDELLGRATALFPPGTPKTVVLEEALRRMVRPQAPARGASARPRSPVLEALFDEGHLVPARATGTPPSGPTRMPLDELLRDLSRDREDR